MNDEPELLRWVRDNATEIERALVNRARTLEDLITRGPIGGNQRTYDVGRERAAHYRSLALQFQHLIARGE